MASLPSIPDVFPPPADGAVDVLFIAGEHSGDEHAARVIADLLRRNPRLRVAAFGGQEMRSAGAQLLFDMTGFSVVGLFEVLVHYGFYRKLFARVLDWIDRHRPRLICFVDYPGFNLRLAASMKQTGMSRKGGGEISLCFYISPQIWAWKAGRRFKMERTLDSVGAIFPFEVECYRDTKIPVRFVGHPFADTGHTLSACYAKDAPVLLLPGSRPKAVRRIFPALLAAWRVFLEKRPAGQDAVVLHPGEPVLGVLRECLAHFPDLERNVRLVPHGGEQLAASAVLTSSGTMSLDLALAGVPGAVVYLANPLTWFVGRRIVKGVSYLGIANILLGRPAWPEYLQDAATPDALAARLAACMDDPAVVRAAQDDATELRAMLGGEIEGGTSAADWLLEWLPAGG
ncbi:MAG: lipid-A-disaccharide synthase [Puniceicoccales bacterium]|jgi:lipid-A-disaccharide synthase|nr:lipid-A-disaccharide synthase [Puniceicoccales bacterium]